jgi:peptidoglycan/LPS O-acetylase OafA/YrhL
MLSLARAKTAVAPNNVDPRSNTVGDARDRGWRLTHHAVLWDTLSSAILAHMNDLNNPHRPATLIQPSSGRSQATAVVREPLRSDRETATQDNPRLECLDALRGIAAVVVLFQHVVSMFPRPEGEFVSRILHRILSTSGSAAVDLFFVLSGFVLTLPYIGTRARGMDYTDFAVRRVMRLYPAYWIAVAVALLARFAISDDLHASALTEWTATYWSVPLTASEVLRTFSMVVPFDSGALNTVFWSLLVEMQISLLLPVFIGALAAVRSIRGALVIFASSIVIGLTIAQSSALQFLPLFVLGTVLAKHQASIAGVLANLSRKSFLALLLLSLVGMEARLFTWRYPELPPQYLAGAGAGLLIMLVLSRLRQSRLLVNPLTHLLGTASYSLYLLHIPVILLLVPPIYAYTGSILVCALSGLILSLILAHMVYKFIETPCHQSGRKLARRASRWINGE